MIQPCKPDNAELCWLLPGSPETRVIKLSTSRKTSLRGLGQLLSGNKIRS